MTLVIITEAADRDTDEILRYLAAKAGRATAVRYGRLFLAATDQLQQLPEKGALRPYLGKGYRGITVTPYLVVYRFDPVADRVEVVRILHTSRDLRRLLPDT